MEATLASANTDVLIGPLQLSLDQSASYIQNWREVTVHSAIPSVSYNGVNTLRLLLSDAVSWADPKSMYISFNIVNEDQTNPLELIGQPHVMFDRVRVRAGGAELEDIALFRRVGRFCLNTETCRGVHDLSRFGIRGVKGYLRSFALGG